HQVASRPQGKTGEQGGREIPRDHEWPHHGPTVAKGTRAPTVPSVNGGIQSPSVTTILDPGLPDACRRQASATSSSANVSTLKPTRPSRTCSQSSPYPLAMTSGGVEKSDKPRMFIIRPRTQPDWRLADGPADWPSCTKRTPCAALSSARSAGSPQSTSITTVASGSS